MKTFVLLGVLLASNACANELDGCPTGTRNTGDGCTSEDKTDRIHRAWAICIGYSHALLTGPNQCQHDGADCTPCEHDWKFEPGWEKCDAIWSMEEKLRIDMCHWREWDKKRLETKYRAFIDGVIHDARPGSDNK